MCRILEENEQQKVFFTDEQKSFGLIVLNKLGKVSEMFYREKYFKEFLQGISRENDTGMIWVALGTRFESLY